jgi:hypothetical protein
VSLLLHSDLFSFAYQALCTVPSNPNRQIVKYTLFPLQQFPLAKILRLQASKFTLALFIQSISHVNSAASTISKQKICCLAAMVAPNLHDHCHSLSQQALPSPVEAGLAVCLLCSEPQLHALRTSATHERTEAMQNRIHPVSVRYSFPARCKTAWNLACVRQTYPFSVLDASPPSGEPG